MLTSRAETILRSIVTQYINKATPVPSQSVCNNYELGVSPATIRHEMARLEQEGYTTRPHPSAGSVPSDKGYRYYVESLTGVILPLTEQRLIGHLFHQVKKEQEEWLPLAATIMARLAQNVAVVTRPKPVGCQFKNLELVALQDSRVLVVLVLPGARVKQRLVTFDQAISQPALTALANKLNEAYLDLTGSQISAKEIELSPAEQELTDCLVEMIQSEDTMEYEEPYLDGWHFTLNQPEFSRTSQMLDLMELVEYKGLLRNISSQDP